MARILVVDDEAAVRRSIGVALHRHDHQCVFAQNVADALTQLDKIDFELVLSDVNMPGQSGLDLVKQLKKAHPDVAVLMVTGVDDTKVAELALNMGAYGYLIKPYAVNELIISVANACRRRTLEMSARRESEALEKAVLERTIELQEAQQALRVAHEETVLRLTRAAEFRDNETALHVDRMSRYCALIATRLSWEPERCEKMRLASMMHDVGKIGIPDQILLKPGKLTPQEYEVIKTHADIGFRILSGSPSELVTLGATIARTHHERIDGNGYPQGLTGDAIPIEGRIAAVADVFDAMTSKRIYKGACSVEEAVEFLREGRGTQFDAAICDLFVGALDEVRGLKARYADRLE